jgi:uncharacterized cupin superfamily protein
MPTVIKPDVLKFESFPQALKDFKIETLTPRLGSIAKSEKFVFDIRKLDPDTFSFPYHFHHKAEELIVILSGTMTLRTEEGLTIMQEGEIVFFEEGESGAHQFYNHSDKPCIYFDLRTTTGIDVAEYPDSGKVNVLPYQMIFEKHALKDYNHGEEHVREVWDKLKEELERISRPGAQWRRTPK